VTISDRGVHPDLLDEETAVVEAPSEPTPARTRSSRRAATPVPAEPPSDSSATAEVTEAPPTAERESTAEQSATPPEWLEQVRQTTDPKEMLQLLTRNLPKEDLASDRTLAGILGDLSDKRARQLIEHQQREAAERAKRDAAQKGDLYALGELAAPEVLQRAQQEAARSASSPFLDGVRAFQETLPAEVQAEVAGRDWPGTPAEGVRAYLQALVESAKNHEFDRELKRREPALRKAWLSEANGNGPTPELDGGPAPGVREITDEQLANLPFGEEDAYLDKNGQPLPGVHVRLTRGIPLRQR
jgi:hypothetical protein